jgi:hypothetical protein
VRWSRHRPPQQALVEIGELGPASEAQDSSGGDHGARARFTSDVRSVFETTCPRQLALDDVGIEHEVVRHELGA